MGTKKVQPVQKETESQALIIPSVHRLRWGRTARVAYVRDSVGERWREDMSEGVSVHVEHSLGNPKKALRVRRVLVVKRRSGNTKNDFNGILTTRDQSRCSMPSLTCTDHPSCHDWAGTMRHGSNGLT
jgi:hypothetical protein